MDKTKRTEIISRFHTKKIVIVGDIMLDKYVWGSVNRISPEAPVPVLLVEKETYIPGGAANAASNIASLGAKAILIGVVGSDDAKEHLDNEVRRLNIIPEFIQDPTRPTITKERIMARNQQILRKDQEKTTKYSVEIRKELIDKFKKASQDCNAVIISDYAKGINDQVLMREIILHCKSKNILMVADFKSKDYKIFKGVDVIAPNKHDSGKILGIDPNEDKGIEKICKTFHDELDCEVVITCGSKGMVVFSKKEELKSIPSRAQEVYDVTGAGDTVSAAITLSLASGATLTEAAEIATYAAAIVIAKAGTATCSIDELKRS